MALNEIERKWLFEESKIPRGMEVIDEQQYDQAYIVVNEKMEVRIRRKRRPDAHNYTYVLCIKGKGTIKRPEIQWPIHENQFFALMEVGGLKEDDFIKKHFWEYDVNGYRLTVGIADIGKPTEFWYGEIEFSSVEEANEFKPPKWFGKEVTDDPNYKMANYWQRTRVIK